MEPTVPRIDVNSIPLRSRTFSLQSTKSIPKSHFDFDQLQKWTEFQTLRRLLKKSMSEQAGSSKNSDMAGDGGFLPPELLKFLLPKEALEHELRANCVQDAAKVADTVLGNVPKASKDENAKTYLAVFAILALVENICDIVHLIECKQGGICDQDLPVRLYGNQDGSYEVRYGNDSDIDCFDKCKWKDRDLENFVNYQWQLFVPTFALNSDQTIRDEDLDDKTILPFCEVDLKGNNVAMSGGYGSVKKVKIHPLCHEFHSTLRKINVADGFFAIKTLKHADRTKFDSEVHMLKRFSGLVHDHLVTLLGTFTYRQQFSMIFPWAECDVDKYWEKENPNPNSEDIDLVRWVSRQCQGIMQAVDTIHNPTHLSQDKRFGRHGDIKPENILWFKSLDEGNRGIWVISDLGLGSFNREQSRSMIPNRSILYTPGYRPPECDIEGGTISRAFDIWTLGCFFLEMICWLLGGWVMKEKFQKDRTTIYIMGGSKIDIFFDLQVNRNDESKESYVMLVKPQVVQTIDDLHNHPKCTKYIHKFLEIIEQDMLVVLSSDRQRKRSRDLLKEFNDMHQKCMHGVDFCGKKVPYKRVFQPPTGTEARLNKTATDWVNRYGMDNRLSPYLAQSERPIHRSLEPKQLKNVDTLAQPSNDEVSAPAQAPAQQ